MTRVAVIPDTGCWEWISPRQDFGYGVATVNDVRVRAHRLAYQLFKGDIPPGMHVLHCCDNPPCCNPQHLSAGTRSDNMRGMIERGRGNRATGSGNGRARLTEDSVREILRLLAEGVPQRTIGAMFGVGGTTVCHIGQRKRWRHVHP